MDICLKDVSFGYGKEYILKEINADVEKGDFVALVGSNGTGKSTLIKLILKIKTGYLGSISILDTDITGKFNYSKIGYVAQKPAMTPFPATVYEVITGGRGDKKKVAELLRTVRLEGYENALIGNLSGGQLQKTFIARALYNDPSILILDEPTVGIDHQSTVAICKILNELNKNKGMTILMTTHTLPYIEEYINKVLFLGNCGHAKMSKVSEMTDEDYCSIYDHPRQFHKGAHVDRGCSCDSGHNHSVHNH